jgi:hypothetical protein
VTKRADAPSGPIGSANPNLTRLSSLTDYPWQSPPWSDGRKKFRYQRGIVVVGYSMRRCSHAENTPSRTALAGPVKMVWPPFLGYERSSSFYALQSRTLGARTICPPRIDDDVQTACEGYRNGLSSASGQAVTVNFRPGNLSTGRAQSLLNL